MSEEPAEYKTGQDMTATEVAVRELIYPLDQKVKQLSADFIESHDGLSESVALANSNIDLLIQRTTNPPKPESQHDKLFEALAKAQGEIQNAEAREEAEVKNKEGKFLYSFKYADLAACLDVIRKPLSDNGLALIQIPSLGDSRDGINAVHMRTVLGHGESGQSISCEMTMYPEKSGPQAVGGCMSYLRRYSLCSLLGVAQFDDDARAATVDPDDYERLTPEQIDEILVLADKHFKKDADAKVNRMLDKAFQVTAVGDIPAAHFNSAINLLNNQAKREKSQAKKPKPDTTESKAEPGADG